MEFINTLGTGTLTHSVASVGILKNWVEGQVELQHLLLRVEAVTRGRVCVVQGPNTHWHEWNPNLGAGLVGEPG